MKALQLIKDGEIAYADIEKAAAPGQDEVRIRMRALSLNHFEIFSVRGMAFARRKLPIIIGAEGAGEIADLGEGVSGFEAGERVAIYPGLFCGDCPACREGRENLCANMAGIMGFHCDGLAAEYVTVPAKRLIRIPDDVSWTDAACTTVTFGTVQHMLFDNARLKRGETILIHAAGSGIGSSAIKMAKAAGAQVVATAGSEEKTTRALTLGADHVINYNEKRFEREVRRLTARRGVDVVFEHVGKETWPGSLLCLTRGGRLVICGSTTGITSEMNLYLLFQQQLRIFGSFGSSIGNMQDALEKMAGGLTPVIDSEIGFDDIPAGLDRLRQRDVFGKIVALF